MMTMKKHDGDTLTLMKAQRMHGLIEASKNLTISYFSVDSKGRKERIKYGKVIYYLLRISKQHKIMQVICLKAKCRGGYKKILVNKFVLPI
jgi:hypothetical protein